TAVIKSTGIKGLGLNTGKQYFSRRDFLQMFRPSKMSYPGRVSTPEGYLGMNGLTATADFFRHQIHQPVKVDPALWSLQISSMEGGEASLTFDELLTLPKVSISN